MRTIWKYPFEIADEFTLFMPVGAEVLHIEFQGGPDVLTQMFGTPCLWALVDTEAPRVDRRFVVRGTGHEMPAGPHRHVGTLLIHGFVWHVFEPVEPTARPFAAPAGPPKEAP